MAQKQNEPKFVAPSEGAEYGFYGDAREDDPREQYTVAGVTGGTANTADTPKSAKPASKRAE
jgi:hypothetical protein